MSREDNHIVGALVELCKKLEVKCFVQVGAEDGYEADEVRKATGCRTIAIEGDTQCGAVSPQIEYHRTLIGATDCIMPFYHYASGLSSEIARGENDKPVMLQQYRLDTFCEGIGAEPDALVIDTEGTTLDVLEGCGRLLDGVKLVYAEVQAYAIRPGIRPLQEVSTLLLANGFTAHRGEPSYSGGAQSNMTWVKL